MSRSSGTGQPLFFKCPRKRGPCLRRHDIALTGKVKKNPGNKRGRMDDVSREYTCSCGHRGWSAHKDLSRR